MGPSRRFQVLLSAAQLLVAAAVLGLLPAVLISGAEFRRLDAGQVERVVVHGSRGTVTLREGAAGEPSAPPRQVGVRLPGTGARPDPALLAQLRARGWTSAWRSPTR